jgi:large exoprotein involved in heme utilization and adhesion
MNPSTRTIPIIAVIAVAALSGALVSVAVERAAVAASAPSAQDPQLTMLLKYVSVDASGNITIKGGDIKIQNSGNFFVNPSGNVTIKGQAIAIESSQNINLKSGKIDISATSSATLQGMSSALVQSNGATAIKGGTVTICCPAR